MISLSPFFFSHFFFRRRRRRRIEINKVRRYAFFWRMKIFKNSYALKNSKGHFNSAAQAEWPVRHPAGAPARNDLNAIYWTAKERNFVDLELTYPIFFSSSEKHRSLAMRIDPRKRDVCFWYPFHCWENQIQNEKMTWALRFQLFPHEDRVFDKRLISNTMEYP